MDRVVGVVCRCDEIVRIQDQRIPIFEVVNRHRDDVVNDGAFCDVEPRNTQITRIVSDDDLVPQLSPLLGAVESLVHPAFEAECFLADASFQSEILESLLESTKRNELRI